MSATAQQVIVNYPTVLTDTAGRSSWIQLARTGRFISKRYGKFEIASDDLRMMAANFRPGVTPIDYDHLTSEVTKPFDGIAAGWLREIELRDGGNTLWGLVEWTREAERRIESREYKFISPSFIKDYVTPTGEKVGTKLLAAALTNMPFLPEMQAVTLNTPAIAAMHLSAPVRDLVAVEDGGVSLSTIGQRVSVSPNHARNPRHVGATFEVLKVDGMAGDEDARVWLKDVATGEAIGWYAASELEPARQDPDPNTLEEKSEDPMKPEERILARAQELATERQISLSAAVKLASAEDQHTSDAYLDHPEPTPAASTSPVINLSAQDGERLPELVARIARERCGGDQLAAYRLVNSALPQMVKDYSDGTTL